MVASKASSPAGYHPLSKAEGHDNDDHDHDNHHEQGMETEQGYNKVVMHEDDDDGETSSFVMDGHQAVSDGRNIGGIFRETISNASGGGITSPPKDGNGSQIKKSPSSASHGSSADNNRNNHIIGATTKAATSSTTIPSHQLHNRSRSSSWEDPMGEESMFDDEDDEDVTVVRRYVRNRIPTVPVEFSHQPLPKRLWQSFVDLRTAARQRRAARLLNETVPPAWHCILTWCCDATDRGIALVAVLMLLWLIAGWTNTIKFQGYWGLGILFFTIRVSARRLYETFCTANASAASSFMMVDSSGRKVATPPGAAGKSMRSAATSNKGSGSVAMSNLSSVTPSSSKTFQQTDSENV